MPTRRIAAWQRELASWTHAAFAVGLIHACFFCALFTIEDSVVPVLLFGLGLWLTIATLRRLQTPASRIAFVIFFIVPLGRYLLSAAKMLAE